MEDNRRSFSTYIMVVALIVGAYFLGSYKTRYDLLVSGEAPLEGQPAVEVEGDKAQAAPAEEKTQLSEDEWGKVLESPVAVLGEEGAAITMVEFTDYQCPFCKRFHDETFAKIKSEYIDTGKVRYVVRDLPLSFHPNAKPAAIAVRCAEQEGKYWEMREQIFDGQATWQGLSDATATFTSYANKIGLAKAAFESCLKDEDVAKAVEVDLALASQVGAGGTPTFYINGKLLVGAVPFDSFKTALGETQQ